MFLKNVAILFMNMNGVLTVEKLVMPITRICILYGLALALQAALHLSKALGLDISLAPFWFSGELAASPQLQ